MKKRIIVAMLSVLMAAMTGCGSTGAAKNSAADSTASSAAVSAEAEPGADTADASSSADAADAGSSADTADAGDVSPDVKKVADDYLAAEEAYVDAMKALAAKPDDEDLYNAAIDAQDAVLDLQTGAFGDIMIKADLSDADKAYLDDTMDKVNQKKEELPENADHLFVDAVDARTAGTDDTDSDDTASDDTSDADGSSDSSEASSAVEDVVAAVAAVPSDGVDEDIKKEMTDCAAFLEQFDQDVDTFIQDPNASGAAKAITDETAELQDWSQKLSDLGEQDMSSADNDYYNAVMDILSNKIFAINDKLTEYMEANQ